jgi:hypothetical protein
MGPVWSSLPLPFLHDSRLGTKPPPPPFQGSFLRQLPTRLWKLKEHTQKTRWQIKNADSEHRRHTVQT